MAEAARGRAAGDDPPPHRQPGRGHLQRARARVEAGSGPVAHDGRTVPIAQANNAFIFPGVGLGTLVAQAREVTDGMLLAAAERLAEETALRAPGDALFPSMTRRASAAKSPTMPSPRRSRKPCGSRSTRSRG